MSTRCDQLNYSKRLFYSNFDKLDIHSINLRNKKSIFYDADLTAKQQL